MPEQSIIYPVFHVSLLKEFRGSPPSADANPLLSLPLKLQPVPSAIISRGLEGHRVQVLVDWEGLSRDDMSWVDLQDLVQMFPKIDLEGKVIAEGGKVDASPSPIQDTNPFTVQDGTAYGEPSPSSSVGPTETNPNTRVRRATAPSSLSHTPRVKPPES